MGLFDWMVKKEKFDVISPSIANNGKVNLTEQFKGEVKQNEIMFPKNLGEEHPFDFNEFEELYKKFGFFTAVVDKYVDFIVGPGFYIESDDDRAKEIINKFMTDINFDSLIRSWAKEALIKGNGFLEIGGNVKEGIKGLKILNANNMYVQRDNKGKIKQYNQYIGRLKTFDKTKVISFNVENIAHVAFNIIADCAYGIGIGYSASRIVRNLLQNEEDLHMLMNKKANAPLHAKLGKIEGDTKIIPKPEDVARFGKDLESMNNKQEWATDPLVEFKVIDYGNIGEKFDAVLQHDVNMLLYAFQVPAVLMGMANIPEGLAKVQMEAFQRRIQSMQAELEKIIEQQIFRRVLRANGFGDDIHVEFEWGSPSVMEVEGRMQLIGDMIKSPTTSMAMKNMLEDEMINLLKLNKDEWEKLKLEMEKREKEEIKRLEAQLQPRVPGQNKSFPSKPQPKAQQPKQPRPAEFANIVTDLLEKYQHSNKETVEEITSELKKEIEEYKKAQKELLEKHKVNEALLKEELKRRKENKSIKLLRKKRRESIIPKQKEIIKERKEDIKVNEYVKKNDKGEYCVYSHQTGKNFGCYSSKSAAEKRLTQIKKFNNEKYNWELKPECAHCEESISNIVDIKEWLGFNYKEYLKSILAATANYGFDFLRAETQEELKAGYLNEKQISSLKNVMEDGFKKGKSMTEMANDVEKKVEPKDLYRMNEDGTLKVGASGLPILARSAEKRSMGIVRSEVTRLANMGAEQHYKENGINQVQWVASFGDRTCPECENENGQIYKINEHPEIPLHPLCRCTLTPVVDLK